MKKNSQQLVVKGKRGLKAAERLFEAEDYDFAVSRAYYAMFHLAEALLLTKQLATSTHSGLLALLYEHFVKPGLIQKELHQNLHHAFGLRQQGDYWSDARITQDMAREVLDDARAFIVTIEAYLQVQNPSNH